MRAAAALGRLAIVVGLASLLGGCGSVAPSPTESAPAIGPVPGGTVVNVPASTAPAVAGSSAAAPSSGDRPPDLLVTAADGSLSVVDPLAPAARRDLHLPAGMSAVTPGPASIAAYTTDPSAATRIALGRAVGDEVVVDATITAPAGERWGGTYPACLNGAGLVILADAGRRLLLVAPGEDPAVLPGQGETRGDCVWPDDGHVLWDESGDQLRLFDLDSGSTFPVDSPPFSRMLSGGAGRLAGLNAAGQLVVATDQLEGTSFTIAKPGRVVAGAVAGAVSADGRWIVAVRSSTADVIDAASAGWKPIASIPLNAGERVAWMPPPTP